MSWRSVWIVIALAVIAAPSYASEWVLVVDPNDCTWEWDDSTGTGTLTCPAGDYVYSCPGGGGGGGGGNPGNGDSGSGNAIGLTNFQRIRFEPAYSEAFFKLLRPQCALLWPLSGASGNGLDALDLSTYRLGNPHICVGASAYTYVGSFDIYLCNSFFFNPHVDQRARTLIHEALHSSGLDEWPNGDLFSGEISQMVGIACPC